MRFRRGIGRKVSTLAKVTTLALATRLLVPVGIACQLTDHHESAGEPGSHQVGHGYSGDARQAHHHDHDAPAAGHSHDGPNSDEQSAEHSCHDSDGNCACSLTFVPEAQPSRAPEILEVRAGSDCAATLPHSISVETDFVSESRACEVFHPPRGVSVTPHDPARGPPSVA